MKTHQACIDTIYHFGRPGRLDCVRLRVYRLGLDKPVVVVATELLGQSFPLDAMELAATVAHDHEIAPVCLSFVVHRLASAGRPEGFMAGSFDAGPDGRPCRQTWRTITKRSLEHVIGQHLTS